MQRRVASTVANVTKRVAGLVLCAGALGMLSMPAGHAANLVTNGDFSSGFSGWSASPSGDPYWMALANTGGTNAALMGAYYDDNIPANRINDSVAQTLSTTPGTSYLVTFQYGELVSNPSFGGNNESCCYLDPIHQTSSNDPSSNPWAQTNDLNVLWGGSTQFSASNFLTSDQPVSGTNPGGGKTNGDYFYQTGFFLVTASGASTTLEFDADDYQQGVILTDISVSAVPTPEPATLALLGSALSGIGLLRRRRRA
jgi:PEP-CTERM motif